MSSNPAAPENPLDSPAKARVPAQDKGKGKPAAQVPANDADVDDDDDDDDDDNDDDEEADPMEEDEDEELDEDDDLSEINPEAILPSSARRTRGARVDYSSAEALEKAGLNKDADAEGDDEEDFENKEKA